MTLSNEQEIDPASSEVFQISLLEEKLQVARRQRKVGEIVIRKQVETRQVRLPIRREKLIVERIGANPEKLAEVVINEEAVNGFKYNELSQDNNFSQNQSQFISLSAAKELLLKLEELSSSAQTKVRIEIITNNSEAGLSTAIKDICDRN